MMGRAASPIRRMAPQLDGWRESSRGRRIAGAGRVGQSSSSLAGNPDPSRSSSELSNRLPFVASGVPDLDVHDGVNLPGAGPPVSDILEVCVVVEEPARNTDPGLALAEIAERLIRSAGPRRLEVRGYFGDDLLVLGTGWPTARHARFPQVNMEDPLLRRSSVCGSVGRAYHLRDIAF